MLKKSFATLTLLFFVLLVGGLNVNADETDNNLDISLNGLEGEPFNDEQKSDKVFNINVLDMHYKDGEFNGAIKLKDGSKINFNGMLYPLKGEGYYGEN